MQNMQQVISVTQGFTYSCMTSNNVNLCVDTLVCFIIIIFTNPSARIRVLVLCEMQSVLSRISNRIAVSISYDDNHYTTCALLLLLFFPWEFFTSVLADGFSLEFEDSKSPEVSRTLLSILAVHNNVVLWMVSTCPPTSKSSSPFNNSLVTVPKEKITIGLIVTFMFHNFSVP